MQTFRSSYGRKGCRVSDRCPTRAIRHHLGNVNVGRSVDDVVSETRVEIGRQLASGAVWTAQDIRDALRFTRWQHLENRAEYAAVMGGMI